MESILLSVTYLLLGSLSGPGTNLQREERKHRLTLSGDEKKRLTEWCAHVCTLLFFFHILTIFSINFPADQRMGPCRRIQMSDEYAPLSLRPLTCEVKAGHRKLDRIFNNNERVIEAGRVGEGYEKQLKEILDSEILPIMKEFDKKENKDTLYEERLQTAADNFIAAASKLPRVSGCFPPCGFQSAGAVYNCVTCKYDSCEFPLDCPVQDITVMENSRSQVWCDVPFSLPNDIEVIWRFAEEVKTQQVDQFKEVTVGVDRLYSIPSTRLHHQGTYQCEIYSGQHSIVRLYYYLTVTPQVVVGQTELQEIFDLSLLPGGRLLPGPPSSSLHLPSPLLLAACLASAFLLLILSLGVLYLSSTPEERGPAEQEDEEGNSGSFC